MPKGDWGHGTRPWHPEEARLFPQLEATPDLSRGEQRFAAEVALEGMHGRIVPAFAHKRALIALQVMAFG